LKPVVYRLVHLPSGRSVAVVTKANGWWAKGWGVLGRPVLPCGDGLWLPGVASVHTLGVRVVLDLLFLDNRLRTVKAVPSVPPGRWWMGAIGAAHTLELGAGTLLIDLETEVGCGWHLEPMERLPT
jgi:hypothetical protein